MGICALLDLVHLPVKKSLLFIQHKNDIENKLTALNHILSNMNDRKPFVMSNYSSIRMHNMHPFSQYF